MPSGNRRLLFLVDDYYPTASANSICVKRIQSCLKSRGIFSDVICYGNDNGIISKNEFGEMYTIHYSKCNGILRRIEKAKNLLIWPVRSILRIKDYRNAIHFMKQNHKYDAIVAVLRPIEGAIACALSGNYIIYELDSISNNADNGKGIKRFIKYRANNIERFLYSRAYGIIHMQSHAEYYKNKKYNKNRNKFVFLDLPGLVDPQASTKNEKLMDNKINIVYTGLLNRAFRSPEFVLNLARSISSIDGVPLKINFYSRGDCEDIIGKYNDVAIAHGYVASEMIPEIVNEADFLLNIGNRFEGTVNSFPSKTIEYIASGKPIIHIYGGCNDSATPYVRKYKNAVIIDPSEGKKDCINKLVDFIKKNKDVKLEFKEIERIFPLNSPDYTVNKILKMIEKQRKKV